MEYQNEQRIAELRKDITASHNELAVAQVSFFFSVTCFSYHNSRAITSKCPEGFITKYFVILLNKSISSTCALCTLSRK